MRLVDEKRWLEDDAECCLENKALIRLDHGGQLRGDAPVMIAYIGNLVLVRETVAAHL